MGVLTGIVRLEVPQGDPGKSIIIRPDGSRCDWVEVTPVAGICSDRKVACVRD